MISRMNSSLTDKKMENSCSSFCRLILTALLLTPLAALRAGNEAAFFEQHCFDCHDAETKKGKIDLAALEVGGLGGTESPSRAADVEPLSDAGVWQMIASGNARGVHHIESPAMTSLACMAGVRDIDCLVAIVSVIRPGAANGLKKAQFARRAQGLEEVTYTHESLAPVLRSTFGVVAYEEHILQICEAFAGLAPGRADVLRRALVKLDARKVKEVRGEFITAARARGRTEKSIAAVWELVAGFQGYAFCRAHSTAYAVEAYQGAYVKHYHPAEFLAAVLTNGKGFYSPLVYTLECRRLGIGFLLPSVNISGDAFQVETPSAPHGTPPPPLGKTIRVPLRCIKDLSEAMLARWRAELAQRPFTDVRDFCERVQPEGPEALNLIRCGAFDGFGPSRTEDFWHCLHSTHDRSAGEGWLFTQGNDHKLRAIFRAAQIDWQWIDSIPGFRKEDEPTRRVAYLTREQAESVIANLPVKYRCPVRFALLTGLRKANVFGLRWENVNLETGMVIVHADEAKAGERILVPLNKQARELLSSMPEPREGLVFQCPVRISPTTWTNATKRAGVPWCRFHDLRHTWASWHAMAGTPMSVLQELGGWHSAEMVRKYAHLSPEHLAAAAEKVTF